jgi:hypothetical protein
MEIAAAAGETAVQRFRRTSLSSAAQARLRAYTNQARQYYEATSTADPIAKPLLGYYFVLNASKAYLTATNESLTERPGVAHGIGQDNSHLATPYDFYQEHLSITRPGVFHFLAQYTGTGFCWQPGSMKFSRLLPYLAESVDLYASAFSLPPALIPVVRTGILSDGTRPNKRAWLVVDISRLALREAKLSPRRLLSDAAAFAISFELVDGGDPDIVTYQSRQPVSYSAMPQPLSDLRSAFDRSLIVRNRTLSKRKDNVMISPHAQLVSSDALTFAVMIHLSNMVRYRPHHVEELRGGSHWWLFTSWVDRAIENFLLSMSSRISLEEHSIE